MHRKGRSTPHLALNGDFATHHLTKALTESQAQSSSAVFAGHRGITLHKRLEDPLQLAWAYADAGVGHTKANPLAAVEPLAQSMQSDLALGGEFGGIAQKVEQYVMHPAQIGLDITQV